jgi:hypothetical protein
MTFRVGFRCAVCALALALLVPGCKKAKVRSDSSDEGPKNNPISDVRNQGAGPGVMGALPAVGRAATLNDLKQFSLWYLNMTDSGAPPAGPEALARDPEMASLQKLFQPDGDVHVYWGANPRNAPGGTSNTVLAYSKSAQAKGGPIPVAMLDGTARTMTKQEFDSAPKAGK